MNTTDHEDISFTIELEQDGYIVGQVEVPGDCNTELAAYLVN